MLHVKARLLVSLLALAVSACASKDESKDLLDAAEISGFTIAEGTGTVAPGESLKLHWSLSAPDLFQVELHLSKDAELDDSDERLLGFGCGASVTGKTQPECLGSSTCVLETETQHPTLHCGDPESPIPTPEPPFNVLGADTGSAHLVLHACNALFEGCDSASVGVTFVSN